jgi:molybdopterin/thiamine biosynthesis adenylyltransferase
MDQGIFMRQESIIDSGILRSASVEIIGVGALGSFIAVALAKMGVGSLTLYDADTVEPHNLPAQYYRLDQVKADKVAATAANIAAMSDVTEVKVYKNTFPPRHGRRTPDITISAVDSMEARIKIWEYLKGKYSWYIDTRMGGGMGRVLITTLERESSYEDSLDTEDVMDMPCSARSIIYAPLVVAGFTTRIVKGILNAEPLPWEVIFDTEDFSVTRIGDAVVAAEE